MPPPRQILPPAEVVKRITEAIERRDNVIVFIEDAPYRMLHSAIDRQSKRSEWITYSIGLPLHVCENCILKFAEEIRKDRILNSARDILDGPNTD